jgi:hypothetical protein
MGHTSTRTTSEHYVNAVRAADAEKFWAIIPNSSVNTPDAAPNTSKVVPLQKSA